MYSSPHDAPWFSDPDYDGCGNLIAEKPERDPDRDYEDMRDREREWKAEDAASITEQARREEAAEEKFEQ